MRKLTLTGCFLVLACSGDESSSETPSSFCEKWAAAACSTEVVDVCQAADVSDCQSSQFDVCLELVPNEGFSGKQAGQCLDAVRAAYTDADLTEPEIRTVLLLGEPCDQLARGPRNEGDACTARVDCNAPDGFDCVFKGSATTGTCEIPELVGAGLDCSADNAVCGEGFYCDGDNCIGGQGIGEACVTDRECSAAGFCSSGTCAARFDVAAPCTTNVECASGICYEFSATERVCTDRLRLSRTDPICNDLR